MATRFNFNKDTLKNIATIWLVTAAGLLFAWSSVGWAQAEQWSHTWTAPASTLRPTAEELADNANRFQNQTLRLIAHTSIGGQSIRLRIANTHGERMLVVDKVTVALQDKDDRIIDASLKTVTFAGNPGVVVPQGAVMLSDGISFAVPTQGNLSISLYFAQATPFITLHRGANQTAWLASGDQTDANALKNPQQRDSWDFLSAIEVVNANPIRIIATVGDSITDGYLSTVNGNNRWPNYLLRRLSETFPQQQFAVLNLGIGGNRVLRQASPRFGENLLARLERDVFSIPGLTHMVLLEGINDIGMGSRNPAEAVTAEELINGYRQVIARAHTKGITIYGATLLPYEGAGYYSEAGELIRRQVNQWIRNSGEFDAVIDFELATRDPKRPTQLRRDFTTDNLHPNDAGYAAMAAAVDLTLFK